MALRSSVTGIITGIAVTDTAVISVSSDGITTITAAATGATTIIIIITTIITKLAKPGEGSPASSLSHKRKTTGSFPG